ncbi:PTS lactose transporter subunit IIB [Streptomonospora nanhaiensis]|uniref:PTS system mannitol-specific IIB component n=1 Tax=Streptomonospora nanhaiensis TaxID=1323731 RepID=A0A853BVU0_9ACTN|nr:PTS lactose transporter subunit IIB [Streptomonospora nanhaiensis]MBV2366916.1 PTS lactose transporter subunit IIB [Streptomonospora nanhaiensis]MBX9390544.1 PTS lactose transporter subunit IIB [Streptomonospora nanhaiensis]NYI98611.1 PTS system mannitol-specific IIB component [Streptomonospora nanhaiensis]
MSSINGSDIKKVVVACDAGMGSSVLLTSQLSKTLKPYSVAVEHSSVDRIPADADLVLCHAGLAARARANKPGTVVVPFQMFMGDPAFARVEQAIKAGETLAD